MQSPCSARSASSTSKLGASATSSVGTTIAPLASTSEARRPMRSESGPQNQAPTASAPITTEMLSPACDGETPNSRPRSGRIAWVEYMTANIAAGRDQERRHGGAAGGRSALTAARARA